MNAASLLERHPALLNQARYQRAMVQEALGRKGRARQELERIFASDPDFGDARERLGLKKSPGP